jgi:hypothetical protein
VVLVLVFVIYVVVDAGLLVALLALLGACLLVLVGTLLVGGLGWCLMVGGWFLDIGLVNMVVNLMHVGP